MQTSIRQQARAKHIAQLHRLTQSGSRCAALSLAASMRRSNWAVKPNFGRSLQSVHLFGYPSEDTAAIKGLVSEITHHRPPLRT